MVRLIAHRIWTRRHAAPLGSGSPRPELYNVQRLGADSLDPAAKVVISTIQRVFAQLTGTELSEEDEEESLPPSWSTPAKQVSYSADLPPETFDIIVVDKCHRSFTARGDSCWTISTHVIDLTDIARGRRVQQSAVAPNQPEGAPSVWFGLAQRLPFWID